ncbi:MAG: DNA-3-methyladenine glycosylase 2 family protein [Chloroflexi bacterium]|nr:DNA-3-methyladenine glycosylase 2 family protein [Chloroflexota bacterium]
MHRTIDPVAAVAHLSANDPVMGRLTAVVGPFTPRPAGGEPFRSLTRSIVFQQLSGKAASTILSRFVALFGEGAEFFPAPEAVLAKGDEQLRAVGLSRQKIASVRSLAEHFVNGELSAGHFEAWEDEEIIAHLTRVRGIGRWTAEMYLMFHLGRPDVLPVNDVGLNRAIQQLYGLAGPPKPPDVLRAGEPWRPWATVACWYLWRSLEIELPG